MKKLLLLYLWMLVFGPLFGQQAEIDSLKKVIQTNTNLEARSKAYGLLGWHTATKDLEKAFAFMDSSYQGFNELGDERMMAIIKYRYSFLYRLKGDYQKAHKNLDVYIEHMTKEKDSWGLTNGYYQKGTLHSTEGNIEKGLDYLFKALEGFEKADNDNSIGFTTNVIGFNYQTLEHYEEAIKMYDRAIKIHRKVGDSINIAADLHNMGLAHSALKNTDSAKTYLDESLAIAQNLEDDWLIGLNSMALGEIEINVGNFNGAIPLIETALKEFQTNDIKDHLGEALTKLGFAHFKMENLAKAESYFLRALKKMDVSNTIAEYAHENLSKIYEQQDDFKKALDHYKLYNTYKDSILSVENIDNINELQTKYESAEKDKEIAKQNLRIQRQETELAQKRNQYRLALISGVGLLLLTLGLVSYYRQRQKLKNQEISSLKKTKEIQVLEAAMQGEENERTRIAKDLHDGVNGDLAAIKYKLTTDIEKGPLRQENPNFKEAIGMLDNACEQIRRISHDLTPPSLQQFTLSEALQQFCQKMNGSNGVQITYQFYGAELQLPKQIETNIYRLAQELVNNTVKHSKATEALVQLNHHDTHLDITVEDNGNGFDPQTSNNGIGLKNVRNRAQFLNAELEIKSDSEGSTFLIHINLDQYKAYDQSSHIG